MSVYIEFRAIINNPDFKESLARFKDLVTNNNLDLPALVQQYKQKTFWQDHSAVEGMLEAKLVMLLAGLKSDNDFPKKRVELLSADIPEDYANLFALINRSEKKYDEIMDYLFYKDSQPNDENVRIKDIIYLIELTGAQDLLNIATLKETINAAIMHGDNSIAHIKRLNAALKFASIYAPQAIDLLVDLFVTINEKTNLFNAHADYLMFAKEDKVEEHAAYKELIDTYHDICKRRATNLKPLLTGIACLHFGNMPLVRAAADGNIENFTRLLASGVALKDLQNALAAARFTQQLPQVRKAIKSSSYNWFDVESPMPIPEKTSHHRKLNKCRFYSTRKQRALLAFSQFIFGIETIAYLLSFVSASALGASLALTAFSFSVALIALNTPFLPIVAPLIIHGSNAISITLVATAVTFSLFKVSKFLEDHIIKMAENHEPKLEQCDIKVDEANNPSPSLDDLLKLASKENPLLDSLDDGEFKKLLFSYAEFQCRTAANDANFSIRSNQNEQPNSKQKAAVLTWLNVMSKAKQGNQTAFFQAVNDMLPAKDKVAEENLSLQTLSPKLKTNT